MKFLFEAEIYKVVINPCIAVPLHIAAKINPVRGYIPIKGKITRSPFKQTLAPVKEAAYRLFVNGGMLNDTHLKVGGLATFVIEEDPNPPEKVRYVTERIQKEACCANGLRTFHKADPVLAKKRS